MEEILDIFNEQGEKIREAPKSEAHHSGLLHRTAHVWFLNSKGQLLIQKRAKNKKTFPGYWDNSASGHVAAGKSSVEGAYIETKEELGFSQHEPLIVITGGGLGATTINNAFVKVADDLLGFSSVALVAGKANVDELSTTIGKRDKLQLYGYVASDTMQKLLGAADIVVSRAGATTLLELAALAKPSIIVPNENLTGGHQLKNAAVYKQAKAIVVLEDARLKAEPLSLVDAINATLLNKDTMKRLSTNIREFAKPDASKDMMKLIIGAIE